MKTDSRNTAVFVRGSSQFDIFGFAIFASAIMERRYMIIERVYKTTMSFFSDNEEEKKDDIIAIATGCGATRIVMDYELQCCGNRWYIEFEFGDSYTLMMFIKEVQNYLKEMKS